MSDNEQQPPLPAEQKPADPDAKKLVRVQFPRDATAEQIYEGLQELFQQHQAESQRDEKPA